MYTVLYCTVLYCTDRRICVAAASSHVRREVVASIPLRWVEVGRRKCQRHRARGRQTASATAPPRRSHHRHRSTSSSSITDASPLNTSPRHNAPAKVPHVRPALMHTSPRRHTASLDAPPMSAFPEPVRSAGPCTASHTPPCHRAVRSRDDAQTPRRQPLRRRHRRTKSGRPLREAPATGLRRSTIDIAVALQPRT